MVWNFDTDNSIPFPDQPPLLIAPLRWMTCKIHPSWHYLDGAKSDSSTPDSTPLATKCKTSHQSPACQVSQKVINIDCEDDKGSNASGDDGGATTEPITEPTSDGYEAVQAMVDTDMVRSHCLSLLKYPYLTS